MRWYSGGISEAIAASKANNAIFVVYLEGTNEQSAKITHLIETGEVGKKLEARHFVAIKIKAGSLPHQQFSEIFIEPSVPSIYFIGKNATPLDIITGKDDLDSLSKRIDIVLQKGGITDYGPTFSEILIQTEQLSSELPDVVCENGVCTIQKKDEDAASASSIVKEASAELISAEEKLERAKELLQKKREEKERQEKENERMKEIERRKLGQNVQQLKKWQEDQEMKQIKEERDREKRENQQARDRVLAQIAQDKAERLSKSQARPASPDIKPSTSQPGPPKSNTNSTRLQFKMPNGTSSTQQFANSDTLETVIDHIRSNLNVVFEFRLSTTFPRREFTVNDYPQTLIDLGLSPTAVILVLPVNHGTVSTNQGGALSSLIWSLFGPFIYIFGFFRNFLFGGNADAADNKGSSGNSLDRREKSNKRSKDSTTIKKQGNVHRLSDKSDSDEDSNTWNGNSTQQM